MGTQYRFAPQLIPHKTEADALRAKLEEARGAVKAKSEEIELTFVRPKSTRDHVGTSEAYARYRRYQDLCLEKRKLQIEEWKARAALYTMLHNLNGNGRGR